MKKIFLILIILTFLFQLGKNQTSMTAEQNLGSVKVWNMTSATNDTLGKIYTIEQTSKIQLLFSPDVNNLTDKTMVVTGTYTSSDDRPAGFAYNENCNQVGNTQDKYFKPNAYLVFQNGSVSFSEKSNCNSVQVYKLIDDGLIFSDVVNARTKQSMIWRLLVQKKWTKEHKDGLKESGVDLMIVDFSIPLTLNQACSYVQGLQRDTSYQNFSYVSKISGCLLDTGTFRPFLLNGKSCHGNFPTKQSNVIVIE